MPTNAKETKGVGKALTNPLGLFSLLFGLLTLLGIVFIKIGGIFISKSKLFQLKRVKIGTLFQHLHLPSYEAR